MRINTEGDALCVPLSVAFLLLPLVDGPLLLLLCGLLCGLLRGCLLRCFLGCHLPILPFDDFDRTCNSFIAVEECIDSCNSSVK